MSEEQTSDQAAAAAAAPTAADAAAALGGVGDNNSNQASEAGETYSASKAENILPEGPAIGVQIAKPLHIQRLEHSLYLEPFLQNVENLMNENISDASSDEELYTEEVGLTAVDEKTLKKEQRDSLKNVKVVNGLAATPAERKSDKRRLYNFSKVRKGRKWLKNILLSDSSDSSDTDEEAPINQEDYHEMLRLHIFKRQTQSKFYTEGEEPLWHCSTWLQQYQYYSTGLLSNYDRYLDQQRVVFGPQPKPRKRDTKKFKEKLKKKEKLQKTRRRKPMDGEHNILMQTGDNDGSVAMFQATINHKKVMAIKDVDARRRRVWMAISKKDIPKAQKHRSSTHNNMLTNARKLAQGCQKELRRSAIQSQRQCKETPYRARRLTREMMAFWKHYDKVEKEHRKKAEKEAQEQRRLDDEIREAKRTQRKLNFLITQTELYAHFMSSKLTGDGPEEKEKILSRLEDNTPMRQVNVQGGVLVDVEGDDYDGEFMKQKALDNASNAYTKTETERKAFDADIGVVKQKQFDSDFSLTNPSLAGESENPQPKMFNGELKEYQLKGMNWLANLYDCGINGILADEMGLGKTVQSIAFFAHLAETQNIWGPFLVIAPASTLHNWQQECARFVPGLKTVPYWGNPQDRRILREVLEPAPLNSSEGEFHILITSYQLVVQDIKYFQRIKWHYMILDEAQAIKSSTSVRWKILLGFSCRNRLLLTGTPIQNSMAELWALLHFIMPNIFDSHEEFNEWFSKDIESHAEKQSGINEEQLSRLHMILKPFMLRRVKKDVENELSDKIEVLVYCYLTTRQRHLYQGIKNKISIEDLLQSSSSSSSSSSTSTSTSQSTTTNSLMNLVMQFRKVCNHPELFERRETKSPFHVDQSPIVYTIPKLVFREGLTEENNAMRNKILYSMLSIFAPDHIHNSLFPSEQSSPSIASSSSTTRSCFSFTRFVNMSPAELHSQVLMGMLARWLAVYLIMKSAYRVQHAHIWQDTRLDVNIKSNKTRNLDRHGLLLWPVQTTHFPNRSSSVVLRDLIFTSPTSTMISHTTHKYHFMQETAWHRKIRTSKPPRLEASVSNPKMRSRSPGRSPGRSPRTASPGRSPARSPAVALYSSPARSPATQSGTSTPTLSPRKVESSSSLVNEYGGFLPMFSHRPPVVRKCQLTSASPFLYNCIPKVTSMLPDYYCSDRSAMYRQIREHLGGSQEAWLCALYGALELYHELYKGYFYPSPSAGLSAFTPHYGWSNIQIPDKQILVTDSGKLYVLDVLLRRLKDQNHRVLIYSQMTRMIDLLEEFMWHRKHTYMRLDGSSKISDRRDMVADFQNRSDIFVFLLSTRAGGLGINLTAADTVIFYDSDWNPTVDQQAMDRAHRLGQTKQVTVYRLICKGTIEERILERAKEKSEIQRMVISGGNFKPDQLKPKEVVSLLLDDDEIERKYKVKEQERKKSEEDNKAKDRKRKRDKYAELKMDVMKKPKGPDLVIATPLASEYDTASMQSIDGELESIISMDSQVPSPLSLVSVGSEQDSSFLMPQDENSNDALVIVDDDSNWSMNDSNSEQTPSQPMQTGKRGRGRPRSKPIGPKKPPGRPGRPRKVGTAAAAIAGARAGAVAGTAAAYAAYGFNFTGHSNRSMSTATRSSSALSSANSPTPSSTSPVLSIESNQSSTATPPPPTTNGNSTKQSQSASTDSTTQS
ncbi:chromatin-remodeling ATPase INO80-like [Amphiura filiformis]|uniref:chromatin-remodeling ATPase INO80-like n=1 Tax=Amphiura filiformis TaxID=82378 RepID=UPI003B210E88